MKKEEDGPYLVFDRGYKPVGFRTDKWVDYGEYPMAIRFKCLWEDTMEKISVQEHSDGGIFPYDGAK